MDKCIDPVRNGVEIEVFLYGRYRVGCKDCYRNVGNALQYGFSHWMENNMDSKK